MVEVSRRRFLTTTSLGVGGAVAAIAALPNAAAAQSASLAPPARRNVVSVDPLYSASVPDVPLLEPIVLHVRDMATAEMALLVGTDEFVYRDTELLARLVQTARQAANTEG